MSIAGHDAEVSRRIARFAGGETAAALSFRLSQRFQFYANRSVSVALVGAAWERQR